MKPEKLIAGLIITAAGFILLYMGYQKLQPDILERGMNFIGELSKSMGEEMPVAYKKDKTPAYIMMVLGVVLSVTGIAFILKSNHE